MIDILHDDLMLNSIQYIKITDINKFSIQAIEIQSEEDNTVKFTICESIFEVIGLYLVNNIIKIHMYFNYLVSYLEIYIKNVYLIYEYFYIKI
ncbi:MAG: hypothetical protein U1E31_00420 [Rickettsiales bacterium]